MYYKKSLDIENAYAVSDIKYDDDYIEMDDSLFEQDELGDYYLKTFLKNPSSEYIKRLQKYKDLLELSELKQYLSSTDYVIIKLNEAKIEDEELFNSLKTEYSDILTKRKEARVRINELENN